MKPTSRSIVLADDNDDDAFLTKRAMESAGVTHSIHHCRDGQAVIDYLEGRLVEGEKLGASDLPDVLLLDLKMPRLGGLETLKWIRSHETFKSLVVLALTSSSEERDVKAAYDLWINAYLVKPSSLTEMIDLARAIRLFWLDQNHLIRPRANAAAPIGIARP
ncbi:MAG TPA: response regulator [Candidatus Methylacidiphilales bacterium]